MKHFKIFLAFAIFLASYSISQADIPNLINFQGILDSAGNPLANKTVSVEFKIYNALVGGTLFWSETQSVTTNAGGVFNVILGTSNPIPDSVFDDTIRYLGIKVGTDAEMTPRQQIVSNAYGYRVSTVDGATGGVISGNTSIQSDLFVDGKVGIGTTTPISKLTVYDDNTVEYGLRVDKVTTGGNSQAVSAVNSASPADGFASHGGFFLANANAVGSFGNKVGVRGQAFGTGNDNKAGWFQASGATNNYAIYADLGRNYFADNVGIGTASPGNILTVVASSVTDPIADAWTTYSSAEYKQGIRELSQEEYSEALHKLLVTPVVKYRYKGQTFMDKEKIGIVIEEAPEEIVSEGNAKAASLNEYISLLHAGLKAQQTKIEVLEKKLKQLTKEE